MPVELPDAARRSQRPTLLPERWGLCGPATARKIGRLLALYGLLFLMGYSLASSNLGSPWQTFGAGLMLPGGGFMQHADHSSWTGLVHFALAGVGVLSFCVSVFVWFATGNVLAPVAVWCFFAIGAAGMTHGDGHPSSVNYVAGIIGALAAGATLATILLKASGAHQRRIGNAWLRANGTIVAASFANRTTATPEFSHDDVKRMRFLLDRALQPISEFEGFEWLDQYQTAAIRYQLHFIGYALSMAQATHLPAFGGYLGEAQRRLILKQTDYRVWRYWTIENLWGNLRYDPDPVKRENIMFTGFCAAQMAMYHNATGRDEFDKPDSFILNHPSGKQYRYSQPSIIEILEREAQRSDFHLIACEPNWIYPLCNTIVAAAIRSHSPEVWSRQAAAFRSNLDGEFLNHAGWMVPCRSNYAGLAIPSIGGVMPQAMPSFFLNATLPDVAMRQWLLLRRLFLDGRSLRRSQFWRVDTGNYRFSRASAYAATALAAAELGDEEVRKLCLTALDEECPVRTDDHHFHRPKASVWAHAVEFLARSTLPNAFDSLMNKPMNHEGPRIESVSYPDVLIASAHNQHGQLQAALYPGGNPSRQKIGISGLSPGQRYNCEGTVEKNLLAGADARAVIHLNLDTRKEILISRAV